MPLSEDLAHLLCAERAARGSFYATRVGFVAVNPAGQRIARAHNGFPVGVAERKERWSRSEKDFYHLHAEAAGVFYTLRHGHACLGATAYITHPPCPGCAALLVAAGFARIVFSRQAMQERPDWQEDTQAALAYIAKHGLAITALEEGEQDDTAFSQTARTELALKQVYDQLLPEMRWAMPQPNSAISLPAKPENPQWLEHPVIRALLEAAKRGTVLAGRMVVTDNPPECRAATALIQAGVKKLLLLDSTPDPVDARWAVPLELARAAMMLREDAGIVVLHNQPLPDAYPPDYFDATRNGFAPSPALKQMRP